VFAGFRFPPEVITLAVRWYETIPGFVHSSHVGKDGAMPSRFDKQTRAKAVRLVQDHVGDYESEGAAIKVVSARLGTSAETLRRWIR
jgi:transposase